MRNFREYDVWIDSMEMVEAIYIMVSSFPSVEKFSLSSQITRSAVSIPSNIAEGASRTSQKDFARFLEISLGSCFELETQLRIAKKRMYSSQTNYDDLLRDLISLQKRIYKLRKKVLT